MENTYVKGWEKKKEMRNPPLSLLRGGVAMVFRRGAPC